MLVIPTNSYLAKAFDMGRSIVSPMPLIATQSVRTSMLTKIPILPFPCGSVSISSVKLLRGVKQGDPLSPIIFNLIIDELLDNLPSIIGVQVNDSPRFNNLVFADDLIQYQLLLLV